MKDTHIVVLHGWTASQETEKKWQPCITSLQSTGFKVTFLLLPGLTQSLSSSWNLDQYVDWAHSQISHDTPFMVIGHSFGGQIAIRLAAKYPKSVNRLVLIDSSGIPDQRWWKRIKRCLFWLIAKGGKRLPFAERCKKIFYQLTREQDYYRATDLQKETMRQVIREDMRADAERISVPTLIVWGEADATTPLFMGQTLASLISSSQLMIIKGARHSPQYTHPKQVADLINQWHQQMKKDKKD